jgi:DNA-directed RNA polymerase subunit alpha
VIERNWNELIRPEKPQIETGADATRKARIVAEPLERGFGVTLGNALRRVLLSSLQGAAVTAIQIDGVVHEFSSLEGVREDVVDIVLNIKQLAVRMHAEGPKRMTLRATGPGPVTAGQIETPADIEILNPDHVLCTLDDGASVRMEFTVNTGKGYVPADRNRPEDAPIGLIAVDALYSPVKRVAYRVEPTRQGQSLDYDKLILEVETNGAVTPVDAVAYAARILQDQLQIFITFEEPKEDRRRGQAGTAVQPGPAEEGRRTRTVGPFGQLPEERQHRLYRRPDPEDRSRDAAHPELRPQVLNEIKEVLAGMGLHLGMDVPNWPPENIEDLAKKFEDQI